MTLLTFMPYGALAKDMTIGVQYVISDSIDGGLTKWIEGSRELKFKFTFQSVAPMLRSLPSRRDAFKTTDAVS